MDERRASSRGLVGSHGWARPRRLRRRSRARRGVGAMTRKALRRMIEGGIRAQVDEIAAAVVAGMRPHLAKDPARRRGAGQLRLPAAEAARRSAVIGAPIDDATRARVQRAMRRAGGQ